MGFYRDQLLPRVQDKVMDRKVTRDVRHRVCASLQGDIVEVGFGTGLNTPFYPPAVTGVCAIEPSETCLRIARQRMDRSSVPIPLGGRTGELLALPDEEFDWHLVDLDVVHDPGSPRRPRRDAARPEAGRRPSFHRAWASTRRRREGVAAPA